MKLYLNATSPFARLARIVAIEKGLAARTELCWVNPWQDDARLLAVAPLARVPVLITDEGTALTESLLIARYLDDTGVGASLVPEQDQARTLALAGLGHGLMEAAFQTVIAHNHDGADADATRLGQRRRRAIRRSLESLAQWRCDDAAPEAPPRLGELVIAVALEYLAFRLPELVARSGVSLAGWQALAARESFVTTAFPTG